MAAGSITRPKGRVRIETRLGVIARLRLRKHHPAERPGAD